jgi:Tn3 transposase DDE domain
MQPVESPSFFKFQTASTDGVKWDLYTQNLASVYHIVRDEQRKFIKCNHLVAYLLIYHDVIAMSNALERLAAGHTFDEELVSYISPYLTEHINLFGRYTLKRDRVPEPLGGARC